MTITERPKLDSTEAVCQDIFRLAMNRPPNETDSTDAVVMDAWRRRLKILFAENEREVRLDVFRSVRSYVIKSGVYSDDSLAYFDDNIAALEGQKGAKP